MARQYFIEWLFLVLFWTSITLSLTWIGVSNMEMLIATAEIKSLMQGNSLIHYMSSGLQYFESVLFGIIFGSSFTLTDIITDRTFIRNRSIAFIVIAKSIFYFIAVFLTGAIIYAIYAVFEMFPGNIDIDEMYALVNTEFVVATVLFFSIIVVVINFVLQLTRKLGFHTVKHLVTGKYSNPKEEEIIVAFIDLKDSTAIAEKLGHKKYSKFIQSCFNELTDLIIKHKAHVYQYVGDEVVLMWLAPKGLKKLNCINLFFAFEEKLSRNKPKYLDEFEVFPVFKAGMDMGKVTVVEIGEIKKEIALHGDVINTASRIQHYCSELDQKLLISNRLENKLPYTLGFEKTKIEGVQLRGKNDVVNIYSIEKLSNVKCLGAALQ